MIFLGGLLIGLGLGLVMGLVYRHLRRDRLDDFRAAIYQLASLNLDLNTTLRRLLHVLERYTQLQSIDLILKDPLTSRLTLESSRLVDQAPLNIAWADLEQFDNYLVANQQTLLSLASLRQTAPELAKIMLSYGIEILIGLQTRSELVAYIALRKTKQFSQQRLLKLAGQLSQLNDPLVVTLLGAQARATLVENQQQVEQEAKRVVEELERSNRQLCRLDQAKDDFVTMVSHQLRTPLTSIKGYLSLLLEGDAGKMTKPQRQLLDEAFCSSQTMAHVINDFLSVSRLQTGRFSLDRNVLDLATLVADEVSALQKTAQNYDLKLELKIEAKIPSRMLLDDNKIRQALGNLLDNAIYYSPPQTEIVVCLAQYDNDLRLTVRDQGIGVPPAEREKLFSKFYRASSGKRRRPDGTGIGLYLVREIIRAHGGQVFYYPLKQGSEFGFNLPIDQQLNPGIFVKIKTDN